MALDRNNEVRAGELALKKDRSGRMNEPGHVAGQRAWR
jgi:hypothetical protein